MYIIVRITNKNSKENVDIKFYKQDEIGNQKVTQFTGYAPHDDEIIEEFKILALHLKTHLESNILYSLVLDRLARPLCKQDYISLLLNDFGIKLDFDNIYNVNEEVDFSFINKMKDKINDNSTSLLYGKISLVFYDYTTLYFQSFKYDDLKKNKYIKELQLNRPPSQILLSLLVNEEGLQLDYNLFPILLYEGDKEPIFSNNLLEEEKMWDNVSGLFTDINELKIKIIKIYQKLLLIEYCFEVRMANLRIMPIYFPNSLEDINFKLFLKVIDDISMYVN